MSVPLPVLLLSVSFRRLSSGAVKALSALFGWLLVLLFGLWLASSLTSLRLLLLLPLAVAAVVVAVVLAFAPLLLRRCERRRCGS